MNREEVQDQYNCTGECDGVLVEILSHYWHTESGELWIKTDQILDLENDIFKADTFIVNHAGCLALYILKGTIGKSRARNGRTFCKAREWREWVDKFVRNTKKRIAPFSSLAECVTIPGS